VLFTLDVVFAVDAGDEVIDEVIDIGAKLGPNVGVALGIEDDEGDEDVDGAEVIFGSCPKIKLKFCTFDTAFLLRDG